MAIIRLADGREIDTISGLPVYDKKMEIIEPDKKVRAIAALSDDTLVVRRRNTNDLPLTNYPSLVRLTMITSLTIFGLSKEDIAKLTGWDVRDIVRVLDSEDFTTFRRDLIQSIRIADQDGADAILQRMRIPAAREIAAMLQEDDPRARYIAAKEILSMTKAAAKQQALSDDLTIVTEG